MTNRLFATTGVAVVLTLSLAACGGGGGGGERPAPIPAPVAPEPAPTPTPTPPPPPPPPPPSNTNFETSEYRASNSAMSSGALSAYQNGATGKGVKIGVIDSGINPNLSEFAGKIDPASRDVAGSRGLGDDDGHGTAVSAVAAAAKNDSGMHGVAFDATIVNLRADAPGTCADTSEDGGCAFYDNAIATGIDAARQAGARVINISLGGGSAGSAVLSAMQRAVSAGVVIVISAGNDGEKPEGANADPFAAVPAERFPTNVIIAGSVGVATATGTSLDQLSTFSNRAGASANSYLAALGYRNRTVDHRGTSVLYSGTSFAAPTISGAVALLAQAFPNLTGAQIVEIMFKTADDLGAKGVDSTYGRGRLNVARAFEPIGTTTMAGTEQTVAISDKGDLPAAAGDAGSQGSMGAIILDGYSRAFVLDLARTLRQAEQARPMERALQGRVKIGGASAGALTVAMTVSHRSDLPQGFALEKLGIGPDDARQARLIAGSAVARLDRKTAIAFGFSQGAKALQRQLSGAQAGAFLIAKDVAGDPGFATKRGNSMALRRDLGSVGMTLSGESGEVWQDTRTSATGSPYRWTSLSLDRSFGRTWISGGLSRLEEQQTLLGGRMTHALGGGGSSSLFLDLEARRDLGGGWSAGLNARRGWTSFATGQFASGAYGADVTRLGVLNDGDRVGLRVSQPLRVEEGGLSMFLPTAYDYETLEATSSWTDLSLTPSGREVDAELSYATPLGRAWFGGNVFIRKQPSHIAAADDDYGAAIRFTLGF